jgi:hypothetical protein
MLNVLKSCNLEFIRKKFIIIYLLNVTDIIFTLFLLKTGLFVEVNSLMRSVVGNEGLSIGIKVIVPLIVLPITFIRMKDSTNKQLMLSNRIINTCLIIYVLINISHCVWSLLYVATVAYY